MVLTSGAVKCWGLNKKTPGSTAGDGVLGYGDTEHRGDTPAADMGELLPVVNLGAVSGAALAMALCAGCWEDVSGRCLPACLVARGVLNKRASMWRCPSPCLELCVLARHAFGGAAVWSQSDAMRCWPFLCLVIGTHTHPFVGPDRKDDRSRIRWLPLLCSPRQRRGKVLGQQPVRSARSRRHRYERRWGERNGGQPARR